MFRFIIALSLFSAFTFNTHASSIPQELSTGADGIFNLLTGEETLYGTADNIYNFADFNVAEGAILKIDNSGPVYIYTQQNITVAGTILTNSSDLHLISQSGGYVSGITSSVTGLAIRSTETGTNFVIIGGYTDTWNPPTPDNGVTLGNDLILTTGTVDTITAGGNLNLLAGNTTITLTPVNNSGTITLITAPSPVPVPAALWLMLSGLLGMAAVIKRRRHH